MTNNMCPCSHYIGPGTSAAANHRAACLNPVCAYPGCSQEDDVSFPATKCTHVSTNMSLIRLPCKAVDESPCNAPPRRRTMQREGPWARVNKCCLNCQTSQAQVAVDFCQHGSTLHLPVRRLGKRGGGGGGRKVSEVLDPLTNAIGKCLLSLEHSITVTYEMCNRMKPAALVNKLSDEEKR